MKQFWKEVRTLAEVSQCNSKRGLHDTLSCGAKVFVDACSLMHMGAHECFLHNFGECLLQNGKRFIIPIQVVLQLRNMRESQTGNAKARKRADRAIRLLGELQRKGLLDLRGRKDNKRPDDVFLSVFARFGPKHDLALITQDRVLVAGILNLMDKASPPGALRIRMFRIKADGSLLEWGSQRADEQHCSEVNPFRICTVPRHGTDGPLDIAYVPTEGDVVASPAYGEIRLKDRIGGGGEGTIYRTDKDGLVCKVYKPERLRHLVQQKVELMLRKAVDIPGVCWPKGAVYTNGDQFVGYLMDEAGGRPMQPLIFIKPVLQKNFPHWTRSHLVDLALNILEKISLLHQYNIIIGDINPLNILVVNEKKVYLVDTDSYQIEDFPCPVGTVNFSAPEIQGRDYKTFLRTFEHEYFAVATLLFMILLPGKPPFSHQGGGTPGENIRRMDFSYPLGEHSNKKAPDGPWKFIWSHMPYKVKEAFYGVFRKNQRLTTDEWLQLMRTYRDLISKGHVSDELFPTRWEILRPVSVLCSNCGVQFEEEEKFVERLISEGKKILCSSCLMTARLQWITVHCFECGAVARMKRAWINQLESQGKRYVCKKCREHWRPVHSGVGRTGYRPAPQVPLPPSQAPPQRPYRTRHPEGLIMKLLKLILR